MNIALLGLILAYIAVVYVIFVIGITFNNFCKLSRVEQSYCSVNLIKEFIALIIAIVYITTYYIS